MNTELHLSVGDRTITLEQYGATQHAEKVVVFCHGFPGTNHLANLADALKDESVMIIKIDYTGDKKSQGKFSFQRSIEDVQRTAEYLRDTYHLPLSALGYSMGGFYVLNVARRHPHLFEKIILLNSVVDARALFANHTLMNTLWKSAANIISLENPEFYEKEIELVNEQCNPMNFAQELTTPIALVQSTNDKILSPETAKQFYTLLNCPKAYQDIPHGIHDAMGDEQQLIQSILE